MLTNLSRENTSQKDIVKDLVSKKDNKEIFKLDSIASVRTWDYSLPTLVKEGRFTARMPWTTSTIFTNEFFRKFPLFKNIDLSNIAIYGGFVVDELLGLNPHDIDLAIISDKIDAVSRIMKLVNDIKASLIKDNETMYELDLKQKKDVSRKSKDPVEYKFHDLSALSLRRFKNVYTLVVPSIRIPIQIIDKSNSSLTELFSNIDIGCSAVAYYENEIQFSALARFCFESLAFPVSGEEKSQESVQRIQKYFDKGFDVILPNLDLEKIPKRNLKFGIAEVIDLPYLNIFYKSASKNKLEVPNLVPTKQGEKSDGAYDASNRNQNLHKGVIIHKNVTAIVKNRTDDFICEGSSENIYDAFSKYPIITERMITNVYETAKKTCWNHGKLDIKKLDEYISSKNLSAALKTIFLEYKSKEENDNLFDDRYDEHISNTINDLFNRQTEETINAMEEFQRKIKNNEIEEKIKCISQRSRECTPKEWYGEYYKDI